METIRQLLNTGRRVSTARAAAVAFLLSGLMFLPAGFAKAQEAAAGTESPLTPWFGVWTIVEEANGITAREPGQETIVEIRPTTDSKGLDISRKAVDQPEVKEQLILDGSRQPVDAQSCSGWKSARLVPKAGVMVDSSQIDCKETGSITTTSLRMILSTDEIVDILALKSSGETRVAVRRLSYVKDLPAAEGLPPGWAAFAARTSVAMPWKLPTIIELSKLVDSTVLQAALLEKKSQLSLTQDALREMKKAKLSTEVIDLVVALAYPDQFHIERNGQVELRPWIESSASNRTYPDYPSEYTVPGGYYPNIFYNCYSAFGYYAGLPYSASCWSYYSPFWWDYPVYIPASGSVSGGGSRESSGSGRLSATHGYVQIAPRESARRAKPREEGMYSSGGTAAAGTVGSYPGTYSSGSSGSSGGGSYSGGGGGGASSAPSASPGGYSSGSGSGGTAVPR